MVKMITVTQSVLKKRILIFVFRGGNYCKGSPVDVGLKMDCLVDKEGLEEGVRLTVDLDMATAANRRTSSGGRVVAPSTPRLKTHLIFEFLKLPAS